MNDWMGISFFVVLFSVFGNMIYCILKMQDITRFEISFLVSRSILLKKRMKVMIQLSLVVAFINSILFTFTIAMSNTNNYGFLYNIFAGFLFFLGFDLCALCIWCLVSSIHNIQMRIVIHSIVSFGVCIINIIFFTKFIIWNNYHSVGILTIMLAGALVYLMKETYKKCDVI